MKKIIAAGIVRVLEFDSTDEAENYLLNLAWKGIRYKVNYREDLADGRVIMNVTTGYNDCALIESIKKIGEEGDRNGNQK